MAVCTWNLPFFNKICKSAIESANSQPSYIQLLTRIICRFADFSRFLKSHVVFLSYCQKCCRFNLHLYMGKDTNNLINSKGFNGKSEFKNFP